MHGLLARGTGATRRETLRCDNSSMPLEMVATALIRDQLRPMARLGWVVLVASLSTGCVRRFDVRSMFAVLTFPEAAPTPRADLPLQAWSVAQLELLTAWNDPHRVATCLRPFDGAWLETNAAILEREAGKTLEKEAAAALALVASCDLDADDRPLLALNLGRLVLGLRASMHSSTTSPQGARALADAAAVGLTATADLLDLTPARANQASPALALSGGSANGAFTAGYLYELFLARELALQPLTGDVQRDTDRAERFVAVTGTSVGSLQTQLVDLYFSPPESGEPVLHSPFFDAPPAYDDYPLPQLPQVPGREAQRKALELLYRSFVTVDERTLLCAEDAPITAVVGVLAPARPNLIRFDPMTRNIIDPMLRAAGERMTENDVLTSLATVDTTQNQLVGLDERLCRGRPHDGSDATRFVAPGTLEYCRSAAVMASVVLPFFARPVSHVYALPGALGSNGAWLDGGLRSTLPVYRALRATRPRQTQADKTLRVLALTTLRADGLPSPFPKDVPAVALNAVGQLSAQTISNELVLAEQFARRRDADLKAYGGGVQEAAPALERSDAVHAVFVPVEAANGLVAEAGYAFDPYVMRGLFTWGRAAALRDLEGRQPDGSTDAPQQLATRLGWDTLAPGMLAAAQRHRPEVEALLPLFSDDEVTRTAPKRREAGRARVLQMQRCGPIRPLDLEQAPAFFNPGGGQ